jgi:hypothetical protein
MSATIFNSLIPIPMVTISNDKELLFNIPPLGENSSELFFNVQPSINHSRRKIQSSSIDNLIYDLMNDNEMLSAVHDIELLVNSLQQLEEISGHKSLKDTIVDHVRYIISNRNSDISLHTVILGPQGDIKITIGVVLSQIWQSCNVIENNNHRIPMRIISRMDLIGKYVGSTSRTTQRCLDEATPVLMIDEAYSLVYNDQDEFGREAVCTIDNHMANNNYPVIITDTEFTYPPSLHRKFNWRFQLDD